MWMDFLITSLVMCAGVQDRVCNLLILPQWMYSSGMWRTIWSVFLFIGVLCLAPVQNWLSKKGCVALGGISFEIYILHWPVICSLSAGLFVTFYGKVNTDLFVMLLLGAALLVTIAFSEIFKCYYEKYCMQLIKWIERKLGV